MILEIRLPALGEGITDATIIRWLIKEGDFVKKDVPVAEIATDKVDTEILAPGDGILSRIIKPENSLIEIGEVIALIATDINDKLESVENIEKTFKRISPINIQPEFEKGTLLAHQVIIPNKKTHAEHKFISPFVRTLALQEGLTVEELYRIIGTGENDRITKEDVIAFITNRKPEESPVILNPPLKQPEVIKAKPSNNKNEEYVELDRVRKVIAENMVRSKQISPHVSSFVEVNVSNLVNWRTKNKQLFQQKYHFNLTYLPLIMEATARALRDFPRINAVLKDDYLVLKKDIHIGIATALPNGNLVVPVIKNADNLSWSALAKSISELAQKAKSQTIQLSDIQEGTFTLTNAGSFGNLGGTPIILQPQLAILAIGAVVKKPVVIKTGDNYGIAIQDMVELWLSYDHRVIDGFLGGSFLKRIADYLEQFDDSTPV